MTNCQTATDGAYLDLAKGEGLAWAWPELKRNGKVCKHVGSDTGRLTKVYFTPQNEPISDLLLPASCHYDANPCKGYLVIQASTIHFYPGEMPLLRKK